MEKKLLKYKFKRKINNASYYVIDMNSYEHDFTASYDDDTNLMYSKNLKSAGNFKYINNATGEIGPPGFLSKHSVHQVFNTKSTPIIKLTSVLYSMKEAGIPVREKLTSPDPIAKQIGLALVINYFKNNPEKVFLSNSFQFTLGLYK